MYHQTSAWLHMAVANTKVNDMTPNVLEAPTELLYKTQTALASQDIATLMCLKPQLLAMARTYYSQSPSDTLDPEPLHLVGQAAYTVGDMVEAMTWLSVACDRDIQMFGWDHPQAARSMHNVALVMVSMGQGKQALPYAKEATTILERHLGLHHPSTITSMSTSALAACAAAQYSEAWMICQLALDHARIGLPLDGVEVAQLHNTLSVIAILDGQWSEAESHASAAYRSQVLRLGADHPTTILAKCLLAAIMLQHGKFTESAKMLRDMLAQGMGLQNHPMRPILLARLAHHVVQEDPLLAKQAMLEAVLLLGRHIPPTHPLMQAMQTTLQTQQRIALN